METETKAKRKRSVSDYIVEYQSGDTKQWDEAVGTLNDTAAGLRWIKSNGVPGKFYRVVRLCMGPVTVSVEKVEKRTLT